MNTKATGYLLVHNESEVSAAINRIFPVSTTARVATLHGQDIKTESYPAYIGSMEHIREKRCVMVWLYNADESGDVITLAMFCTKEPAE